MKQKLKNLIVLSLASILISGCIVNNDPSSSSSSSSSISGDTTAWSETDKALIEKYCGSLISFPSGLVSGKVNVEEITAKDSNGDPYTYLQISDQSKNFSLKDYYKTLEKEGWSAVKNYNDEVLQKDASGTEYIELTSKASDGSIGYDLIYYFSPKAVTVSGLVPACNVINCYNDLSGSHTNDEEWSSANKNLMQDVLCTSLPFIKLGTVHAINRLSQNALQMVDKYSVNLTSEYVSLLKNDGYNINVEYSEELSSYILSKTLQDGATIDVMVSYFAGNNITAIYTPNVTTVDSWPTLITDKIKSEANFDLPTFDIDEGGHYYTYKKNSTYYIIGDTTVAKPDWAYETKLDLLNLKTYDLGEGYRNWEETVSIAVDAVYDDSYSATVGLQVAVTITEPTNTFSSSWPSDDINDTIVNILGVSDFSLPEFVDVSTYSNCDLKYEIRGQEYYQNRYIALLEDINNYPTAYELDENATDEEKAAIASKLAKEEMGIYIQIQDKTDIGSFRAYEEILTNAFYHTERDENDRTVFEDKDGKIAITLNGYWNGGFKDDDTGEVKIPPYGVTTIFIHKGSNQTHTPKFEFENDNVEVAIGRSTKLSLIKDMYPYDVAFSSNNDNFTVNENGVVSVKDTTSENETATITAKININGEDIETSCTLKAIRIVDYTAKSTIETVLELLQNQGYGEDVSIETLTPSEDFTYYSFSVALGDASSSDTTTVDSLKTIVETNLVPDKTLFEQTYTEKHDDDTGTDTKVYWTNRDQWKDDALIGKGIATSYRFYDQVGGALKVELDFAIYVNNTSNQLILKIDAFDCD